MPNILEISMALVFRTRLIVLDPGARQEYIFHLGNQHQHTDARRGWRVRKEKKVGRGEEG